MQSKNYDERSPFEREVGSTFEREVSYANGRFLVQMESPIFLCEPCMSTRLPIPYILQQFVGSGVVLSRCGSMLVFDASRRYCRRLIAFILEKQK